MWLLDRYYLDPRDVCVPLLVQTAAIVVSVLEKKRKEGNVLFNDALSTFYLRLYGVSHMVKDHSDSEKGNAAT